MNGFIQRLYLQLRSPIIADKRESIFSGLSISRSHPPVELQAIRLETEIPTPAWLFQKATIESGGGRNGLAFPNSEFIRGRKAKPKDRHEAFHR